MINQAQAIGPTPAITEIFVGALLYSSVTEVVDVLRHVVDDDVDPPASAVLSSIRALAGRGVPPGPQLVADDLKRRGKYTRTHAVWFNSAVTSGACSSAAKYYAAAVVAASFRRQIESFGSALSTSSSSAAEVDIAHLSEQAATRIRATYARLQHLRGDGDE